MKLWLLRQVMRSRYCVAMLLLALLFWILGVPIDDAMLAVVFATLGIHLADCDAAKEDPLLQFCEATMRAAMTTVASGQQAEAQKEHCTDWCPTCGQGWESSARDVVMRRRLAEVIHAPRDRTAPKADAKTRSCVCKVCKCEVDPYLAIERIARDWKRWAANLKQLQWQETAARSRLADLMRRERNAKTRLRKAKEGA